MTMAPYACRPEASLGRAHPEPEDGFRGPHQRDRDRIVHATAFRRLEYKTQVFVNFEGDHFRTRLTHSLEVAQVARTLSRGLALNEDLAEAVALAHDLGHPPFGHAGEAALDGCLRDFGGFDHNVQTFRVLTRLERRYAEFDGLNLTFETLEGLVKHNGPITGEPPRAFADHPVCRQLDLRLEAPLEAQVAAIADDVAYTNHDLDDGLRAGHIGLEDLRRFALARAALEEVEARHGSDLERPRLVHETIRRLIGGMVRDLLAETRRRVGELGPADADAVRAAAGPLVGFSPPVADGLAELRGFLRQRVYRHYKVSRMSLKAKRVVSELFEAFAGAPECLPDGWRERAGEPHARETAEVVRDYIAGMTDRYAVDEHDRLFKLTRERG